MDFGKIMVYAITTEVRSSPDGTTDLSNTILPKTKAGFIMSNTDNKAVCEHKARTVIAFEDGLFQVLLSVLGIIKPALVFGNVVLDISVVPLGLLPTSVVLHRPLSCQSPPGGLSTA